MVTSSSTGLNEVVKTTYIYNFCNLSMLKNIYFFHNIIFQLEVTDNITISPFTDYALIL